MWDILLWVYLINAVLLILHEIDSAYWKEWELFRLPGGVTSFLLVHIPILLLVLYGLVLVSQRAFAGLVLSLILGFAGVFAFSIHAYFIRRGRDEFKSPFRSPSWWQPLFCRWSRLPSPSACSGNARPRRQAMRVTWLAV